MSRLTLCCCIWLLSLPAWGSDQVIELATRPGVTERYVLIEPANPVASVILFAGGEGELAISPQTGIGRETDNFLVRTRQQWAAAGFQVAVVDTPSDDAGRDSADYAHDMLQVAADLQRRHALPVWLVGTSRGTTSATAVALADRSGQIHGLVLSSSIVVGDGSVSDFALEKLHMPVLLVHHRHDSCRVTPYDLAAALPARLGAATAQALLTFDGGISEGPACKALAHHGYNGIEDQVVSQVSQWIKTH
jgi:pimeloyl-ACP methyl ester carboxylesterase